MSLENPEESGGEQPTQHSNGIGSLSLYLLGAGAILLIALLAFAY
ncbi:MAG: hypothetical protein AAF936_04340 [Pseudomonadota bacterium]